MEKTQVNDELVILAYKQGDYDTALRLLPTLQKPMDMKTSHNIVPHIPDLANADDVTLLHLAAHNGWIDIVTPLVDKYGCDSKCCDSKGQTPLHYAAYGGSQSVVEYLISEQEGDPKHAIEDNGGNSLHCACLGGHLDLTKYLINEHGCNADHSGIHGETPLHAACSSKSSSLNIVKYLINEQHCDPNSKGRYGRTPLHYACNLGHINIIDYLIADLKFDSNLLDNDGNMPIHIASFSGCLNVVKYLVIKQDSDPNSRGEDGKTPLHFACLWGHIDIIQYLTVQIKLDPSIPDNDGDMPIHLASIGGHLNAVMYLIVKCHCDPNSKGESGRTPLHYACYYGRLDIMQYLITIHQCDPALPDDDGNTSIILSCFSGHLEMIKYFTTNKKWNPAETGNELLSNACGKGHIDIVRYLITEQSCDPNSPDENHDMPIHMACFGGHLHIVKYLISEHHCDPYSKGSYGRTPLHGACGNGHLDIIHYLIKNIGCDLEVTDNDDYVPLHMACYCGHLDVVKCLIIEYYCNPIIRTGNGYTLLHCACVNGHLDIVQYLIEEQGFDPEIMDNDGLTPIYIATLNNQISILKYLINGQLCNTKRRLINGRTLLHAACCNGHLGIVQYLIKEIGWNPEVPDNYDHLPLHLACINGHLDIVECLITEHHCNLISRIINGFTPLHCACVNGHQDIVRYLIQDKGCDPEIMDNDGYMPIHIAAFNNHINILKYLIDGHQCDPNIKGKVGKTPLDCACTNGHLDVVRYLLINIGCDPAIPDNDDDLPIHSACYGGQVKVVQYLITTHHCDPNSKGYNGTTPLHCACANGNLELIQYLIRECHCDPEILDNNNRKPIHIACITEKFHVVQNLIEEYHCDPNSRGLFGWTPLHNACERGHMDIVQYLIKKLDCSPEVVDDEGRLPLHVACLFGHVSVVKWLLQDERMNAERIDRHGRSLLHYAELSNNSFDLLKLLRPLLSSVKNYPIQSFTKVVFTGNCGAGKSSLAQVIIKLANRNALFHIVPKLAVVDGKLFTQFSIEYLNMSLGEGEVVAKPLTAGIDSCILKNKAIGNLVLYDLAGQSEYYFSQSVIMETVMRKTPAIFINLVDLSKSDEEITRAIHYWLSFIVNAASKASDNSCVIMVGSHADVLSEKQLETKTNLVRDLMDRRVKKLNFDYFMKMDCRKGNNYNFFPILAQCQRRISANSQPVSIYCHMLYSFLQTKLDKKACQFHELVSYVSKEESLPSDHYLLNDLLEYLSDKGLIIYLKNNQCQEKSWIVIKREIVLKDINGELYKPKYFRGHHPIASSTGIIRASSLLELFPQYDLDMLVELMVGMEFCHPVDLSYMKTNLRPIDSTSIEDPGTDNYLFFPSLLVTERPQTFPIETQLPESEVVSFGWCLGCMDYEYQFFTSRFLHVLLLRLAYTFPLPSENYTKTHTLGRLERRCTVWTNGISWKNEDGISTIVEIIQLKRWVVVTMYHDKEMCTLMAYSKHRSAVIRLLLDLQKELAPDLDAVECLISPSLLQQYKTLNHLHESDLFVISDVANSMLTCKSSILNYKDGSTYLPTKQALFFEPYHLLSPTSVCELMDDSKSNQLVSHALLNEVKERCQMPQLESQSHLSLRKLLDNISIFAGRNPLEVAGLDLDTILKHSASVIKVPTDSATSPSVPAASPVSIVDLSTIPDGKTLKISHLAKLLTALKCKSYEWFNLGLCLGLEYGALKAIEADYKMVDHCLREMLAAWLNGQGGECNKKAIDAALSNIS